jgi:predicted kinase
MKTLYILQGIPGSGKSTLAQRLVANGKASVYFEADQWMMENGQYKFDPTKLAYCHNQCQINTKKALEEGKSVIVSNTMTRRKDLNIYLDIAEKCNVPVRIIKMKREYKSIHNVPADRIDCMKFQIEKFDWKDLPDFVTVVESTMPPTAEFLDRISKKIS